MTRMHVPNDVVEKGHKSIQTVSLGTANLEQQQTNGAVTRDKAMRLIKGSNYIQSRPSVGYDNKQFIGIVSFLKTVCSTLINGSAKELYIEIQNHVLGVNLR
jgi:hypothetical protein